MQQESPREGVGVFRLNMRVCSQKERGFLCVPFISKRLVRGRDRSARLPNTSSQVPLRPTAGVKKPCTVSLVFHRMSIRLVGQIVSSCLVARGSRLVHTLTLIHTHTHTLFILYCASSCPCGPPISDLWRVW